MKSPGWAMEYARDVIGDRWPEAESIIKKDDSSWWQYQAAFGFGKFA